jgi:hypothetical protein
MNFHHCTRKTRKGAESRGGGSMCYFPLGYNYPMQAILAIRQKFASELFEFSRHATDQVILRGIQVNEIRQAIQSGEVIEDYPEDKYGPSCLVLGFTRDGRPLHIQCSNPTRPIIKVITVYEPDPVEWVDYRVRR